MCHHSMNRISLIVFCVAASPVVLGQIPDNIKTHLEQLAAADPEIAGALESLRAARAVTDFSESEFIELVLVDWVQYRISPDGRYMLGFNASGSGSVGATLGSGVRWTDKETGEDQYLSYQSRIKFLDDKGLAMDIILQPDGEPATTTEYVFENLGPVTVVLKEMPDGSRHVARFVPVVEPKPRTVDYTDQPLRNLKSAVLLAGDTFAGEFSVRGSIVGITAGDLGLKFQFGLKPFGDARAIGRTDGRTIWFDHQDRHYRLVGTEQITALGGTDVFWNVYINIAETTALGNGTWTTSYDALIIEDVLESLTR